MPLHAVSPVSSSPDDKRSGARGCKGKGKVCKSRLCPGGHDFYEDPLSASVKRSAVHVDTPLTDAPLIVHRKGGELTGLEVVIQSDYATPCRPRRGLCLGCSAGVPKDTEDR